MKPRVQMTAAMLIFGSIGIFARWIDWPGAQLALARAVVGALVLVGLLLARGRRGVDRAAVLRPRWPLLLFSGAALGGNWILLFEAYRHTSVAVATICYYCAPVLVLLAAPFVLRERLTPLRAGCAAVCVCGMVLTVGGGGAGRRGVLLALGAAVLYACVMLCNRKLAEIPATERTLSQLLAAAVLLTGYVALAPGAATGTWGVRTALLVLVVGVLHTGVAYRLYFSALGGLPAQTSAVLSYLDPATAVLCSAFLLREPVSAAQAAGAVLILGATLSCELWEQRRVLKERGAASGAECAATGGDKKEK